LKVLIIGAGRVGSHLAQLLSNLGHDITVVDKNERRILAVMNQADVEGLARDVTDPSFFEEIDLAAYDAVVVATDRDEVNLFVASIAKLYNVERIFVRAKNPQTVTLLNMIGVESAVVEPVIAANIIFAHLQGRYEIVNLVSSLSADFFLVAGVVKETSRLRGKLPAHAMEEGLIPGSVRLLAVFDGEKFYSIDEAPVLDVGHVVIALVTEKGLKEFSELL